MRVFKILTEKCRLIEYLCIERPISSKWHVFLLRNNPFMHLFKILTEKCRLIEHLCIETSQLLSTIDTVKGSHLIKFVTNSPNLTSLRLIRFRLTDEVARILAQVCLLLDFTALFSLFYWIPSMILQGWIPRFWGSKHC
ncbi:hypothetical protein DY000_02003267 [Brassica cretica]|uniref:FBD domain-containing protein n=1 Tax=Brassica cretica TaxID=69181 RepID=A0ABQ7CBP5_BRACR|nr:hypothetical protein DY000_02003267 [Brassica cretica]